MRSRGHSLDAIANHLRVNRRSVNRYLALPCPEPPQAEADVDLGSFFMKGACGSFPELDWLSRSPLMQAECKAICLHCPVLAKCRSYGLNKGLDDRGVWGAMTKAERQREASHRDKRGTSPQRADIAAEQQGVA
jgi:WhiB family redox-sensing transcriptional regulator